VSKLDAIAHDAFGTLATAACSMDQLRWKERCASRFAVRSTSRRAADFSDLTKMIALQEELDWLCYDALRTRHRERRRRAG
jgi:hypothetical protein